MLAVAQAEPAVPRRYQGSDVRSDARARRARYSSSEDACARSRSSCLGGRFYLARCSRRRCCGLGRLSWRASCSARAELLCDRRFLRTGRPAPTLKTYRLLVGQPANVDILLRTLAMAVASRSAAPCSAFRSPITWRDTPGRTIRRYFIGVMLPMWSSYLIKVYAWRLILAKEGIIFWAPPGWGSGLLDAARPARGRRTFARREHARYFSWSSSICGCRS